MSHEGGVLASFPLAGVPHNPKLTIVGVGTSATGTAGGWVLPAEMTALKIPLDEQMLYRFASAGSAAAVNAGIAAVRRTLPAGSVAGTESWLTVKAVQAEAAGPWVPFLAAFGVIGLVMSVLIAVNLASGDPIEVFGYQNLSNNVTFYLAILKYAGQDPHLLKYFG